MAVQGDERRSLNFRQILDLIIEEHTDDLHVAIPACVESYDPTKQTISARPAVRRNFGRLGERVSDQLPVLTRVPVVYPQGGGFAMTWPLSPGDFVLLVFSERSLDEWIAQGGADSIPRANRTHHITDAVAIAGLSSPASPLQSASATDLVIGEDAPAGFQFCLNSTGFDAGNQVDSLMAVLADLVAVLKEAKVFTALGLQGFDELTDNALNPLFPGSIAQRIQALKKD